MKIINTHEAKTHLSKILEQVAHGKVFIIGKAGIPVARIIPYEPASKTRKGGKLQGKIKISSDFDELPQSFVKHFS